MGGTNGAGKTTTLEMLSGEVLPNKGDAFIKGISISNVDQARQHMGFCPQKNALFPNMTAREHLKLYAILKGIPNRHYKTVVQNLINQLNIEGFENKRSKTLSGGMKRKLQLAIALIGSPPVLFLDEPTTGMDPLSRREVWNYLVETVEHLKNQCVVLTTHSMEECEALCDRLAIMVDGSLMCIGTTQHLKDKFGFGYLFSMHVDPDKVLDLRRAVFDAFGEKAKLMEEHQGYCEFQIANDDTTYTDLFRQCEKIKQEWGLDSYSLTQTTLDEIFIRFAKESKRSDEWLTNVDDQGNT